MTSHERVVRAVTFRGPDRVPHNLPEPWGTDFKGCGAGADPNWQPCIQTETEWEDEFPASGASCRATKRWARSWAIR